MGQIAAVVSDAADIREFDCLLPDDARVADVALRLAELVRLPLVGPDSYPLNYGLVIKGGRALDPDAHLRDLHIPRQLRLRLAPEFVVGGEETSTPVDSPEMVRAEKESLEQVVVLEERSLVNECPPGLRLDVMIDADVHREIEEFAAQDRQSECVGLMLGTVSVEGQERVVHISAVAPAAEAVGCRTSVRMTLDAWESTLRIRDEDYPDLRVLGWFHTHAGWGIFVSDSDVFVHQHFFPHPDMVAYVLDPTTGRDGFFHWRSGVVGLCPNYGLVGMPEEVDARSRARRSGRRSRRGLRLCAVVLLLAGVTCLGIANPGIFGGLGHAVFSRAPRSAAPPAGSPTSHPEMSDRAGRESEMVYTLAKHESLWVVASRIYGDGRLAGVLAEYNGIDDISTLQVGQEIKLPPESVLRNMAESGR